MANGGARKGAGRKPMAIEEDVRGAIKRALEARPEGAAEALQKIWDNVIDGAIKGNEKQQKIFLEYYHGKPKENEGNPTEMVIAIVEK